MMSPITLIFLLSLPHYAFMNTITPTSTKTLLKGPGRILETQFSSTGTPIFYNNFGEVVEASPTDYLAKYVLRYGPIPGLANENCLYSRTYRWDQSIPGKHQGKRIGHFISTNKIFLTVEETDLEPSVLITKNLPKPLRAADAKIYWVNSGDPTQVLVLAQYYFYYFTHDFDSDQYFKLDYFGGGPIGAAVYNGAAVLTVLPEDNGSNRYFLINNFNLYSLNGGTTVKQLVFSGVSGQFTFNFAMSFDKLTNFIFVKGRLNVWLYSWDPSNPTFTETKTYPELTNNVGGDFFYFEDPSDNNKWIFLNGLNTYLQIFYFDKSTKEFFNTGKIISVANQSFGCQTELFDPSNKIFGLGCERVILAASLLTGNIEQIYHAGLSGGILIPVSKNHINFLIRGTSIAEYNIELGLMRPKLSIPFQWTYLDSNYSNPYLMLFKKDEEIFEMDTSKKVENSLLVSKFVLKVKRKTSNYQVYYVRYSYEENTLVYMSQRQASNTQIVYLIYKHEIGVAEPIELADNFLKTNGSTKSAILTFKFNNQNLILWNSIRHASVFRDDPDGVKIVPSWKNIGSCPTNTIIISIIVVNTFEGLFGISCYSSAVETLFFKLNPTGADTRPELTIPGGYSTSSIEYSTMPGEAFICGTIITRISKDGNGDFQRRSYPIKPGEEYSTKFGIPMMNTLPGKVSILKMGDDRSIELFNENPDILVNCNDTNCAYCRGGKCVWCMPYYMRNFEGICQRICKKTSQFYVKATNNCASCHSSCKNCSGPGEKECIKCNKGFLTEDGSCVETGCQKKQKDGKSLVTLEIQDPKENFKFCKTCGMYCSICSLKNDCITCKEGFYMNEGEGCSKGGCKEGFSLTKEKFFCERKKLPLENGKLHINSKSRKCLTEECKQCNIEGNFCFDEEIASERDFFEIGGAISQIIAVGTEYVLQGMGVIFSLFSPETSNFLIQTTQNLGLIRNLRFINVNFGELVDSFCKKINSKGAKDTYKKMGGKFYFYGETAKMNFSLYFKIGGFILVNSIFIFVVKFFLTRKKIKNPKFCKFLFVLKKIRFAINMSCLMDFSFKIPIAFNYMRNEKIYFGKYFLIGMISFTSLMIYFLIGTLKYFKAEYEFALNETKPKKTINELENDISKKSLTKEIDEEKTMWLIKYSHCSISKLVKNYIDNNEGLHFSKYFPLIEKARIIFFNCSIASLQQSSMLNLILLIFIEFAVLWYLLGVQIIFRSFKWIILIEKTIFSILIIFILLYMVFISYSSKISLNAQKRFLFMLVFPVVVQYLFLFIKGVLLAIGGIRRKKSDEKKKEFPSIIFKTKKLQDFKKGLNQNRVNANEIDNLLRKAEMKKKAKSSLNNINKDNEIGKEINLDVFGLQKTKKNDYYIDLENKDSKKFKKLGQKKKFNSKFEIIKEEEDLQKGQTLNKNNEEFLYIEDISEENYNKDESKVGKNIPKGKFEFK